MISKMSYYDGPYCPCCDSKIKKDEIIHQCLIFVNGLPTTGKNHLKSTFEFEHYAVVR